MKFTNWSIPRIIGAFVLAAALITSGWIFCSRADETEPETESETVEEGGTSLAAEPEIKAEDLIPLIVNYRVYQDGAGWSGVRANNIPLKTGGESCISAIWMTITTQPEQLSGTILYQVYISGKGWLDWDENGAEVGAPSEQLPVEALSMKFNGQLAEYYDIYYSVWENDAWTQWSMNGAVAGTEDSNLRVEGLRALAVTKGEQPPEIKPDEVDPSKPMVALTFDDGPSTSVTTRILDSLEANGGRSTFFLVGSRVPGTHAVIQRMNALGCEVANHTYNHKYLTKLGDAGIRSQVSATNQNVAEACGVTPLLVRPPGGYYDKASLSTLGSMGMAAIMWDIDTRDWKTKNAQNTINVVLNQVKDGDIILMHDIYSASADAAEVIIPELVKRGYQLLTVSEMAQYRGGIQPGHVYARFRP